jgi:hypothetical protein
LQQLRGALLQPLQFGLRLCGTFAVHRDVAGGIHATPEIQGSRGEAVHVRLDFRFAPPVGQLCVQAGLRLHGLFFSLPGFRNAEFESITAIGRIQGLGLTVEVAAACAGKPEQTDQERDHCHLESAPASRELTCRAGCT